MFKRKPNIPGVEKVKIKAKIVAKSFSQVEGIDYYEIFSLVVKHLSIRLMLYVIACMIYN